MTITETRIRGLYVIEPRVYEDDRGYFFESFNQRHFRNSGLDLDFVQDNQSMSKKDVVRGLHFQNPPAAQGKLIQVIKGSVLDVAVDIRKGSPTYGEYFSLKLSEANKKMMFLSEGFAHGFLTLEDETVFSYKCTDFYNQKLESGIKWDDPDLNIDWGVENPTITEKDKNAQLFADFNSQFTY